LKGFLFFTRFTETRNRPKFNAHIFEVLNKKIFMEYKVIPFVATANQQNMSSKNIAEQLDSLIKAHINDGWEYVRLESVSTYIQPVEGCFGNTVKPGYMTSYQMVVFSKKENEKSINSSY